MARQRKCVELTGPKKKLYVRCQHCGKTKTIEYRKHGKSRTICGAMEQKRLTPPPDAV